MANLQVKNVPDAVHRKIRSFAERRGRTVRDFVLDAVLREIEREEFRARFGNIDHVPEGAMPKPRSAKVRRPAKRRG